jgi:hypothetical protein
MKKSSLVLTSLVLTLSLSLYTGGIPLNPSQVKGDQEATGVKITIEQVGLKVKRSLKLLYHELFS